MRTILRALFSRGKFIVLAVAAALTLGTASEALGANGGNFILGVATNSATAITQLTANIEGPALKIVNTSTSTGATALNLQTATNKPPMTVNSGTKVTNLNADSLDGKSANDLSRVGVMNTAATLPLTQSLQTYGGQLSIRAPAAGFVRVNGNVTVANRFPSCTFECQYYAHIRHIQSGVLTPVPAEGEALDTFDNISLDGVFPVKAGVNTFDIRITRTGGNGVLVGWYGVLTGEYTPYGSTGTGTLSASGMSAASQTPVQKELPSKR